MKNKFLINNMQYIEPKNVIFYNQISKFKNLREVLDVFKDFWLKPLTRKPPH